MTTYTQNAVVALEALIAKIKEGKGLRDFRVRSEVDGPKAVLSDGTALYERTVTFTVTFAPEENP